MNLTRRFILTGLIASPAVVAIDRLMPVRSIVKPYATVWGVGWDLEVIEHQIWKPMSVAQFGGTNAIDQFREVTQWVYGFPVEASGQLLSDHWHPVPKKEHEMIVPSGLNCISVQCPLPSYLGHPVQVYAHGTTNVVSFGELNNWRSSQRPELNGVSSNEWAREHVALRRKYTGCV
jgi:hypothetical protein